MDQNEKPLDTPIYIIEAWESRSIEDRIKLLTEWREKELKKESITRIDFLLTNSELQKYCIAAFELLPRQIQLAFRATVDAEKDFTPPFETRH
ncbi:MAG: hypothetical protein HZA95_01970 [Candidatus Vogelbacteria bacterium]|nr:hypothetical protein [Candidatus Vogelbacteria bacterium]